MIDSYLQMQSVSKSFGSVKALEAVNLKVEKGSIHALVGENGAGKTTLMRVLYGAIRPDTGTILLDGEVREFRSSKQAIRAGIGMVTQHYSVIPDLTCLQNLILGAEPGLWMALGAARDRAQLLTGQMGFSFDWDRPAAELSPAASQKLEILKLLWRNSRVMILDEPTAMLPPSDGELLYQSLKQLVANGATVVVVTHRLPEVLDHCDHVTVLRGGCLVASKPVSETNSSELAELIVGHSLGEIQRGNPPLEGSIMLDLDELVVLGDRGNEALKGINLKVEKGEVVGVAGVDGSGQRELCNFVAGTTFAKSGLGKIDGRALGNDGPASRIDLGLRVIPEDRLSEGIIEDWSLLDNAVLGYQRTAEFSESGWLRADAGRLFAAQFAERFQTKHGGFEMPM